MYQLSFIIFKNIRINLCVVAIESMGQQLSTNNFVGTKIHSSIENFIFVFFLLDLFLNQLIPFQFIRPLTFLQLSTYIYKTK